MANKQQQQPKTEEQAPASVRTVHGIRVTAKVNGFRRAGRAWTTGAVEMPVSEFTKAQLAQIRAEPMLVVTDIEINADVAE